MNAQDSKYERLVQLLETHMWDYQITGDPKAWAVGSKERATIEHMVTEIGTQEALLIFQAFRLARGF
jgi:hypothetical protein